MTAKMIAATFVVVATTVAIFSWDSNPPVTNDSSKLLEIVPDIVGLDFHQPPYESGHDVVQTHSVVTEQAVLHDAQLDKWLNLSKRKTAFKLPSNEEISRFEYLFLRTLEQGNQLEGLQSLWASDGWRLEQWKYSGGQFVLIREQDDRLEGRGVYIARVDAESKIVLQAPHRFFDSGSGEIVQKLFVESNCRAAAWNTVHRKQYDLAHRRDHFINAFTRALIKFESETVFAQLHGFANEKQNGNARTAELIVSDGTKFPGRLVRTVSVGFKQRFGPKAMLYPLDVKQLGGTKNEQGSVIRNAGSLGFLHLELNRSLREKLKESASLRAAFMDSLADAF